VLLNKTILMSSILNYMNLNFYDRNDVVKQMVRVNVSFFVLLLVCKVVLTLFSYSYYYDLICDYLYLSTPWQAVLHKPWSVVTCFLVHKGVFNLLFVVLTLNVVGEAVVYLLGTKSFVGLYVMGGVFGSVFFLLASSYIPALQYKNVVLYGSTAGVYSLLAGLTAFAPNFSFKVFLIEELKLKYIVFFLIILKLFDLSNGQFDALASIGGMVFGYLYMVLFRHGIDLSRVFSLFTRRFYGNFFKVKRFGKRAKFMSGHGYSDHGNLYGAESPKEEIDVILDKIAQGGYDSLSADERYKLFNYTKK
jgi:membrane associated rhomboid family serine protease